MNFLNQYETASAAADAEPIVVGPSRVCPRTGRVKATEHSQKLRRLELKLIRYLNANLGRTVSRDELLAQVWKCPSMMTRTVDQTISSLRRKVGDDADRPRYVITVFGVGYMLDTPKCETVRPPRARNEDEPEAAAAYAGHTHSRYAQSRRAKRKEE